MKEKISKISAGYVADSGISLNLMKEFVSPITETHQTKRELIQSADDLSTKEKLKALDENDWDLIKTYSATAAIVLLFIIGLNGGGEKAIEGLKKVGSATLKAA